MKITTSVKGLFLAMVLGCIANVGFSQTVVIPGNTYAFQWSGDPDIGLYFSAANSRYEFRDLVGDAEMWCNPIAGITYFRNRVGVNKTNPSASIDARAASTAEPSAIVGRGSNSPNNGYLGVQGDATNFDNISGLSILPGGEIGVLGLSTGGGGTNDNYGVVGYSTYIGMRADNPTSGYAAQLATTNYAVEAIGPSQLGGNVNVTGNLNTTGSITTTNLNATNLEVVRLGINTPAPTLARLEVNNASGTGQAVIGRGNFGPTTGMLGVQGTLDFDSDTTLDIAGQEIGVIGISKGGSSTDNTGLYGVSNGRAVYAEHSVSGNTAELANTDFAGEFNGAVNIVGAEAGLTGYGYMTLGLLTGINMTFDNNEIQVRNSGGVSAPMFLQPDGDLNGNVSIGSTVSPVERLFIDSETGQAPLRARVNGSTKLYVSENGGTSLGSFVTTPPANGLYVAGQVAIATSAPAAGYELSVNGQVICEELTVQNSVSWPDYVFDADYEMPTLSELREEINELGHLPGIPSAEEVAEKGAPVGEMNRLLLEKVEEITLYMFDLQEQINELEKENEALKSQLNK